MGQGVSKDAKMAYSEKWAEIKTAIQSTPSGQELIRAVETWFQKYTTDGKKIDEYASKPVSTPYERDIANGMFMAIDKDYKDILEKEKRLQGTPPRSPEMFRQFRKDFLYEMNWELGEKVSKIKRQAPKVQQPANIPPPYRPSETDKLQARLNALNMKAGRRKTRSKKSSSRKHKYRR